jgi:hypothetical protein
LPRKRRKDELYVILIFVGFFHATIHEIVWRLVSAELGEKSLSSEIIAIFINFGFSV